MRIAASDYDGTICTHGKIIGEVVAAIWKWQEAGNKFGLATGRDLPMTLHETKRWGIPFDFLVCINGATIYDHDESLLQKRVIADDVVPVILQHPAAMASMHLQLSGTGPTRLVLRQGSWFPKLGIPYEEIDFDSAMQLGELGQISLAFPTEKECSEWEFMLREDLGDVIEPHPNRTTIDINPVGINKATGIADLLALKNWQGHEVFTIGDGGNDIAMLKRYCGFTVPGASPEVVKVASKCYDTVADMLNDL